MSGYRGPGSGDGSSNFIGLKPGIWYVPSEINIVGATTRFYLHSALAAPAGVAPAFSASWTDSDEAVRRSMTTQQDVDALANGTAIDWTSGAVALDRQYISPICAPGTLTGSCKMQLRSTESAGNDNAFERAGLRIVTVDGTSVLATLLAVGALGSAAEIAAGAGLTNRSIMLAASTGFGPVVIGVPFRLVVENGYTDVAGTTPEVFSQYGSISAIGDLPEDDTNAEDRRPWFEITVA